jgi:hypothetical protein
MKRTPWQIRVVCITAFIALSGVALFIGLASIVVSNVPAKMDALHAQTQPAQPARTDDAATPILQFESHTCGLLTLSAAYRVYGLSPREENLRLRLGVDNPANPLDSTSTGTLHPDLLRVLMQDGFAYSLLEPPREVRELRSHLDGGDVALFLIARRQNGNLHWVLTDGCEGDHLRIVDSLAAEAYEEPVADFLETCVLSIVAIKPAAGDAEANLDAAHVEGLAELARVQRRLGEAGG